MAFDYNKTLQRIIAKAALLEERYRVLLESRDEARARAEELQKQLEERDKELARMKTEMEYLQIASTIAPTHKQVEEARTLITGLMRDIDRCITDLSD